MRGTPQRRQVWIKNSPALSPSQCGREQRVMFGSGRDIGSFMLPSPHDRNGSIAEIAIAGHE
jgi:hypothetical protein